MSVSFTISLLLEICIFWDIWCSCFLIKRNLIIINYVKFLRTDQLCHWNRGNNQFQRTKKMEAEPSIQRQLPAMGLFVCPLTQLSKTHFMCNLWSYRIDATKQIQLNYTTAPYYCIIYYFVKTGVSEHPFLKNQWGSSVKVW